MKSCSFLIVSTFLSQSPVCPDHIYLISYLSGFIETSLSDKRCLFFYYLRLMIIFYHVYKIHASTFLKNCFSLYTMYQISLEKAFFGMLALRTDFLYPHALYIIPSMPMIGRPRANHTTICITVMRKPIFHHSPWPMKPAPKKIGVTPQP